MKGHLEKMEKQQNNGVWVYSTLLKKPFATLDELKKAEDEYNKAHAIELKKAEEKRKDAKLVEDAYREYVRINDERIKCTDEAYNKYISLRNEFVKKYGAFHATFTDVHEYAKSGDWSGFFNAILDSDTFKIFR